VAGAKKVEYQIASVTLNASQQPTVKFRVLVDGAPLNLKTLPAGGIVDRRGEHEAGLEQARCRTGECCQRPGDRPAAVTGTTSERTGRTYWNNLNR
jgi:hypothetical protein